MSYLGTKPANALATTEQIADGAVQTADLANGSVTQAKIGTGVASTGPAFSAVITSPQTIATGTYTKLNFTSEVFDTNNNYDAANARFQPNIAGYYLIIVNFTVDGGAANTIQAASIYRTGVRVFTNWAASASGNYSGSFLSSVVYLNGSSDYVEAYGLHNTGVSKPILSGVDSCFSATLVRAI